MGDCACDVRGDQLDLSVPPSHFFLELTPECNHACPGCGNVYSHQGTPSPLSAAGWRTVIDRLLPMAPRLRLSGGEPTLHREFKAIVAHLDAQGIPFTVFTNAHWTDSDAVIRFLVNLPSLEGLLVSIHGARASSYEAFTAIPGSFDKAVNNARRAARAGLRICTSTVITRYNYQEIEEIIELARTMGAARATFSRFIGSQLPQIEANESQLDIAIQTIERWAGNGHHPLPGSQVVHYGAPIPHCFTVNHSNGCMAGFVHATVDPWGNLRPCPHAPLIAGNVLEQDFKAIWYSETMEIWRKGMLAQCNGCSSVNKCRGGCQAQSMWRRSSRDPLIRL